MEALQPLLEHLNGNGLPPGVAIVLALCVLTFVTEDGACIAAGAAAAYGQISLGAAIGACFAGIVIGDVGLYWAGRLFGRRLLGNRITRRFVSETFLIKAARWLEERGPSVILSSRFIAGLRLPTYLAAGIFRASFPRFLVYFAVAAAVWTPIAVGGAYFASSVLVESLLFGAVAAFVASRLAPKLATKTGRRLLYGRFVRLRNWEFWPMPVFYLPVVLYVLYLGIRHRGLTVFTCANPSIETGGFVGESKNSIYDLIDGTPEARPFMLKYTLISGALKRGKAIDIAKEFLNTNGIAFPVVLKPDVGERGKDVSIVRTEDELRAYLEKANFDVILQEFADGVEASVFYYRRPEGPGGEIFSITQKAFPTVVGDGTSDLRTLILNDPRAVALGRSYFRHNENHLDFVVPAGERVTLIDIGTHSRGAVFSDGGQLRSHALHSAIDQISRGIEGFYFGRFDIRASTLSDLSNGGPFKIIELNGVSSESTNIYDRKYRLSDAYGILFHQWKIAFEIGSANRASGCKPTPVRTLVRAALRRKR